MKTKKNLVPSMEDEPQAPTLAEWRSEIERLETVTRASGQTVREITRGLGVSEKKARQLLMILKESGRLIVARKPVETVDGRTVLSPCYSIKSEGL